MTRQNFPISEEGIYQVIAFSNDASYVDSDISDPVSSYIDITLPAETILLETQSTYVDRNIRITAPLEQLTVNTNGTFIPTAPVLGYRSVTVDVNLFTQAKTVTPSLEEQEVLPDTPTYTALSKVTVEPIPSYYHDTHGGNITAGDVLKDKIGFNETGQVVGTIETYDGSLLTVASTPTAAIYDGKLFVKNNGGTDKFWLYDDNIILGYFDLNGTWHGGSL